MPPILNWLQAHHIVPARAGGEDHGRNLIVLCPTCHTIADHLNRIWYDRQDDPRPLKDREVLVWIRKERRRKPWILQTSLPA
jgi:5-methylcytosine-specific restriction endonuclease McrA